MYLDCVRQRKPGGALPLQSRISPMVMAVFKAHQAPKNTSNTLLNRKLRPS